MKKRISQPLMVILACFLLLVGTPAWGQDGETIQDRERKVAPGAIRQSIEERTIRDPGEMPDITIEKPDGEIVDGAAEATFFFENVVFEGNQRISSDQLRNIFRPWFDKQISVLKLQELTESVTEYYIEEGYILSQAYLPPQEIEDGRVLVRIQEGKLGRIIVRGNERYKDEIFEGVMNIIHERGAVSRADLERALLLLMDYPALTVRADLMAGERVGTTDIVIHAEETKWWGLGVDYNNFGSENVGKHRFGLRGALYSPFGWGDSLNLNATMGDGNELYYGRLQYSHPLNYVGTRLGLSYSRVASEPGGDLTVLDIKGVGDYASTWLSHPIVRSRMFNWWVDGGANYNRSKNEIQGKNLYDDELFSLRLGTEVQWQDHLKGNSNVSFDLTQGLTDTALKSTTDAESQFTKAELGYSRYQLLPVKSRYLPYNAYAQFTVNGQLAADRLPSSERLHIGGAGTVRGYEQGEYSGDYGVYGTLEFRLPVWKYAIQKDWLRPYGKTAELQLATFIDSGYVRIEDAFDAEIEDADITGAGLGIRFNFEPNMALRVDWAQSIAGEDPDRSTYEDDGVWYIQFSAFY